jgi:hypothetical protein
MIGVKFEYSIKINFKDSSDDLGCTYGKMYGDNETELQNQAKAIFEDFDSLKAMGLDTEKTYEVLSVQVLESKEQV